ncbi:hypothetical protein [Phenylobacterium sp.]|uniref:hypothetical protein n=1 Tax=Phenylobacterium sp. TaxID=1871053 RepID=UPI0035B03BEC
MPSPTLRSELDALRRAVRAFADGLATRAALGATAHVEAVLHAPDAERVFQFEAALKSAWPKGEGRPPRHEVVWAAAAQANARLQLKAFDDDGRLLLRESYGRLAEGA